MIRSYGHEFHIEFETNTGPEAGVWADSSVPYLTLDWAWCCSHCRHRLINMGFTNINDDKNISKGVKFEQISEFERGRIVGLREAGLSYRAVAARVQRNSSTIMRVSKQWTDEGRTARKSGSGPRNVTSAREDKRLVRMAQIGPHGFF
ncbi:transposable element Tc1 transposase [Trichonephila clavipes]|nr:transposable element Tc1 transposase [Trichonephila clavipes]